MRIDKFLEEQKLISSRSKAKDMILEGNVLVNKKVIKKPSFEVSEQDEITLVSDNKYVSRAGFKLEQALDAFQIDLNQKVMIDIGASTGGFCDCALQRGIKKIYAIDVGTNQLAKKIKNDSRVISRENTNARYLENSDFEEEIDFISMDVSFISCTLLLPVIAKLLKQNGESVVLIKPQFEVGPRYLDKHGVCKDEKIKQKVLLEIFSLLPSLDLVKCSCIKSSVVGRSGNEEYLLHLKKKEQI